MRAVLAALLLLPPSLAAQEAAHPRLQGRVVRGGDGVSGVRVILHRVTPDTAGPVDSVLVDTGGRFTLDLPSVPDPGGRGEVYFGSVRYQGIMYFGSAVHTAAALDSTYLIEVSDTARVPSGGAELPVSMRHVILEQVEGQWRVTELFQVENEGDRTLVAGEGEPTWTYPLPAEARDVETGGTDVPEDEAGIEDGRYRVTAAIPPGERQFLVRYRIDEPTVTFPAPGRTRQMELLVREPAPPLDVEGLNAVDAVEMQPGTSFRRYVGLDLSDTRVVVEAGEEGLGFSVRWSAVVLALLLTGVGVWVFLRPRGRAEPAPAGVAAGSSGPAPATAAERRRALLVQVARIDETLEAGDVPDDEAASLRRRRAELVERLRTLS